MDEECFGCSACAVICPQGAVSLVERPGSGTVTMTLDGRSRRFPAGWPLKRALEAAGVRFPLVADGLDEEAWCGVGSCGRCGVRVDGALAPSCVTETADGLVVETGLEPAELARRPVEGYQGHPVGGVGTPWKVKSSRGWSVEVAAFVSGCNLRCPSCQNWRLAHWGRGEPRSPEEAARLLSLARRREGVGRMAVSGGEPTLNRPWLVAFFRALRALDADPDVRIHLDTNGSLLTPDYLDELVEAGMTDCGIDLKGLSRTTFQKITGFPNPGLAKRYLRRAWEAVAYLRSRYHGKVFVGVGIPYNPVFMTDEELAAMGRTLAAMGSDLQVTLLDYRPAFRWSASGGPERPTVSTMSRAGRLLRSEGLKTVLCQTEEGLLGPDGL